ncbi:enoyl-CoA hydratase/isomerase family protein [Acidiferrimicrobium sp. IK]|uniref:enoyl-CoA hydratase/isomerase family protein n=1 Tax=Acidiferrimicrobium sp. IK TaxID=2871700 RepID=UPI0021CB3DD3|nr:enoyl-CoA hydratase-related protein [Acidiferrimicrobium sp. IK]MCU4186866.1 enoyl-CoA hydratase/isomerase family protein [Acidiferrimicrobium sp. IK]
MTEADTGTSGAVDTPITTIKSIDTGTDFLTAEIGADGVGVITFNRPERRNALNPAMYPGIHAALDAFAADSDVGCVMLTGAGSAFCAGGDVRDGSAQRSARRPSYEERVDQLSAWTSVVPRLAAHPQIVLAALPGPAVGAGMALALACDLRIAARSATLVPGWGKLALAGDFGGPWFLTRLLGPARALEWLVDGRSMPAEEALGAGLLNRISGDADLAADARSWAADIAAGPTLTWRYVKANVSNATRLDLADALPLEIANMVRSSSTHQHGEAVRAWAEKRTPKYR